MRGEGNVGVRGEGNVGVRGEGNAGDACKMLGAVIESERLKTAIL